MPTNPATFSAVTPDLVRYVNATFDKIFSKQMLIVEPQAKFVQKRTSTGTSVNLASILQIPSVRIWNGQKKFSPAPLVAVNMPMFPLESSIEIDRWQMMGDAVGMYGDAIAALANRAVEFTDYAAARALQAGYATSYAGLVQGGDMDFGPIMSIYDAGSTTPLFSTAHTFPGSNVAAQSNYSSGSFSAPQTWATAYDAMIGYKGNAGTPLYVKPRAIVHAPQDTMAIRVGLEATLSAVGQGMGVWNGTSITQPSTLWPLDNVMSKVGLELIRLDYLNNEPGVAYMLGEVAGIGPVFQYMLEQLHLVPSVAPDSPNVFNQHMFQWSVEGYGRDIIPTWFTCYRISDPAVATYI